MLDNNLRQIRAVLKEDLDDCSETCVARNETEYHDDRAADSDRLVICLSSGSGSSVESHSNSSKAHLVASSSETARF